MKVEDAFADSDETYAENYEGSYDVEGLLEVDPDVIIHNWDIEPSDRTKAMRELFANNPVAQERTAVQNDRVYVGGSPLQPPSTTSSRSRWRRSSCSPSSSASGTASARPPKVNSCSTAGGSRTLSTETCR